MDGRIEPRQKRLALGILDGHRSQPAAAVPGEHARQGPAAEAAVDVVEDGRRLHRGANSKGAGPRRPGAYVRTAAGRRRARVSARRLSRSAIHAQFT